MGSIAYKSRRQLVFAEKFSLSCHIGNVSLVFPYNLKVDDVG